MVDAKTSNLKCLLSVNSNPICHKVLSGYLKCKPSSLSGSKAGLSIALFKVVNVICCYIVIIMN